MAQRHCQGQIPTLRSRGGHRLRGVDRGRAVGRLVAVVAVAGVDGRRLDGRRCQGAQDRPESRHAGHSMDARRRRYGVAGNLGCYYFWINIPQVTTIINRDRG